ncbi:MAG: hypothetical protein N2109_01725 [Fimbriimonadales bacterium]|nr:hypothetical protein [Fimbriimonadales bacterium]
MRRFRTRQRSAAMTMVEVLTAATLTVAVLFAAVSALLFGTSSWLRGMGRISAESEAKRAVAAVSKILREAMAVVVDANGMGLTFRYPVRDSNGRYVLPPVWDGVQRRIAVESGNLVLREGTAVRVLCRDIDPVDPRTGTSYRIFTTPGGAIIREVTVQIVTRRDGRFANEAKGRVRETVFLRNVPQLTR